MLLVQCMLITHKKWGCMAKTTLRNTQADRTADSTTASRIYPQEPTFRLIARHWLQHQCSQNSPLQGTRQLPAYHVSMPTELNPGQLPLAVSAESSGTVDWFFGKTITRITIHFKMLLIQCMLITCKKWGCHGMAKTTLRNTDHTTTSKNLFSRTDYQAYCIALTPAPI